MQGNAFATGTLLALVLAGVGSADYWLKERPAALGSDTQIVDQPASAETTVPAAESSLSSSTQSISSSRRVVKKGTKKREDMPVPDLLASQGFSAAETSEASLIKFATPAGDKVQTSVLLFNNDRAALFAWLDDPEARSIFLELKQAIQQTFSQQVSELKDDRIVPVEGAPMDVLSFIDPSISSERLIFVRVRNRLFEFHVAPGKDALIEDLIKELGQ